MNEASSPDVTAPAKSARREHIPLGIAYMIAATILFAASSAVSKWLVGTYPVGEVLFTRTAVALITCALFIVPRTGFAVFRTQRLSHHVMRSVSQAFSQTFLLIAFSLMPLAERHRHQFLRAAVRDARVGAVAQGAGRPGALGGAAGRASSAC